MKALHQIEKKGCEALLCAHTAKQKHHAVLAHDFTAHDLVNVVLQCRDFARQLFDAIERHDTHFGVFERDGIAGVVIVDDAIQSDDFTGHLKARDLIASVFRGDAGLEKPGTDGIERSERLAIAKQRTSPLDFSSYSHDFINPLQLLLVQTNGHAEFSQVAVGAGDFDGLRIHGHWSLVGQG